MLLFMTCLYLPRHRGERRVRTLEGDDGLSSLSVEEEVEVEVLDEEGSVERDEDEKEEDETGKDNGEEVEIALSEVGGREKSGDVEEEQQDREGSGDDMAPNAGKAEDQEKEEEEDMFPDTHVEVKHIKGSQ